MAIMQTSKSNHLKPGIRELLSWLVSFERKQGRFPFVSEVAYREGFAERTLRYRLDRLADHELVRYEGDNFQRRAVVTEGGHQAERTGRLPVGVPYFEIGAHAGDLQFEASARRVCCLADLFAIMNEPEKCYFLPIRGDCMDGGQRPIPAGAEILFWRCSREERPHNGALVHVDVKVPSGGTEALLREYFYDDETSRVTLRARNPDYASLTFADSEVEPVGIAKKIISDATSGETVAPGFGLPMLVEWEERV